MPRDGSDVYTQPFPDVTEGTTIESAVYNGFVADVAIDLNTPRPISSGGTGADNAGEAMSNLGGEAPRSRSPTTTATTLRQAASTRWPAPPRRRSRDMRSRAGAMSPLWPAWRPATCSSRHATVMISPSPVRCGFARKKPGYGRGG